MAGDNLLRRLLLVAVITLAWGASPAAAQAGKPYTFHDLGTLGVNPSSATGINASGQVVGASATSSGTTNAFLYPYPGGPIKDLGNLGGYICGANDINASGQVVGWSYLAGNTSHHAFPSTPAAK